MIKKTKGKSIKFNIIILVSVFILMLAPFIFMAIHMNYSYYMPKIQKQQYLDQEYEYLKNNIKDLDKMITKVEIKEITPVAFEIKVIYANEINENDINMDVREKIFSLVDSEKSKIYQNNIDEYNTYLSKLHVDICLGKDDNIIDSCEFYY